MSEESVLVATARLNDPMRRQVGEACEHARVRPFFWGEAGAESGGLPQNPALLIAALLPGQRSIPEDVAVLATQTFQALPLLLLCPEPLVRHSVSLHGGRVVLLGQPLTREKISARIRTAVVGPGAIDGDVEEVRTDDRLVRVRELRGREWWAGVIAHDPNRDRRRSDGGGDLLPTLEKLGRHGFAGLVPLSVDSPLPGSTLQQAATSLAAGLPTERALAALEPLLGADAGVVWFSPSTGQWSLYVPREELGLWLYSPLRLPNLWRIPGGGTSSPWRALPAASGDVVLLAAGGSMSLLAAEDPKGAELARAAEGGGPALLDHLEALLTSRPVAASALVVELR
jgi:hypothetical protein